MASARNPRSRVRASRSSRRSPGVRRPRTASRPGRRASGAGRRRPASRTAEWIPSAPITRSYSAAVPSLNLTRTDGPPASWARAVTVVSNRIGIPAAPSARIPWRSRRWRATGARDVAPEPGLVVVDQDPAVIVDEAPPFDHGPACQDLLGQPEPTQGGHAVAREIDAGTRDPPRVVPLHDLAVQTAQPKARAADSPAIPPPAMRIRIRSLSSCWSIRPSDAP